LRDHQARSRAYPANGLADGMLALTAHLYPGRFRMHKQGE